ncbi:MAG: O-antigen ligase family protein [Candidatus Omnitrophota bacterium]|nr:O-antigen ligase family protein [Candidatus Omnitrophota bacterium]
MRTGTFVPYANWIAAGFAVVCALAFSFHAVAGAALLMAPLVFLLLIHRTMAVWRTMMFLSSIGMSYFPPPIGPALCWALLLLCLAGCWLEHLSEGQELEWGDRRIWICIAGWVVWGILSTYNSLNPLASIKEIIRYIFSFGVLLTYINWLRRFGQIQTMVRWCEIMAVAVAMVCIADAFLWALDGVVIQAMVAEPMSRVKGNYAPTFSELGAIIAAIVPITFAFLMTSSPKRSPIRFFTVLIMLFGVILSTSRASALAAVCGVAVVLFLFASRRVKILMITGVVGVNALGSILLTVKYGSLVTGVIHNLSGRNLLWAAAVRAVSEHPLFGIGPGCWATWLPTRYFTIDFLMGDMHGNTFALTPTLLGGEAHNLFFTKAAEMGLPSLAWIAAIFLSWGACAYSAIKGLPRGWARTLTVGCFASMVGLTVRCFFENGPIIGRGRGSEVVLVWFIAAIPLVIQKIIRSHEAAPGEVLS